MNVNTNLAKKLNYGISDANVTAEVDAQNAQVIFASRHKDGRQMQFIMNYSTMKAYVDVYDGSTWVTHDLW